MTPEFDHVHAAFAASTPGRVVAGVTGAMASAWRTSRLGRARKNAVTLPPPMRIRHAAIAVAVAAGLQPLLIWMMPVTVKPGTPPAVFVAIALLAAAAASRPEAIVAAWPNSRLARWLRG
jgi:peptidoglycan/LPS O-acetylase OafA/YrhL